MHRVGGVLGLRLISSEAVDRSKSPLSDCDSLCAGAEASGSGVCLLGWVILVGVDDVGVAEMEVWS
jgi:hypothetical protein